MADKMIKLEDDNTKDQLQTKNKAKVNKTTYSK